MIQIIGSAKSDTNWLEMLGNNSSTNSEIKPKCVAMQGLLEQQDWDTFSINKEEE